MTYATFIGAITDTVGAIHQNNQPFSMINPFTVHEVANGVYKVEGEAWTFFIGRAGVPGSFEWQVSGSMHGLG